MSQLYDIFFAAQLEDGCERSAVRKNLGKLFKADEATLDKLFSGKPQLIKKGVDKEAAVKYKAALKKAGAIARREHAQAEPAAGTAFEEGMSLAPAGSYVLEEQYRVHEDAEASSTEHLSLED